MSIIPGVSRSAATIVTGMFVGLDRKSAAEFSFLLAVPTMFAATGLDVIKSVGAFISALLAVNYFISYVQRHTFVGFGLYRIVAALVFWTVFLRS